MSDHDNWNQQIIKQFRANGGKNVPPFGNNLLLLTTTGAKSGQPRTTPLVYSRDGDRYVIIASKAGAPTNPDWYHNLLRHPDVTIEVGTDKFAARATEAKGEKRDQLYQAHAARFSTFNEYQQKTSRVIPVMVLDRVAS
ncbi:MAG: nitroreductase family deazaflavin-dependent oxidoreductase [Chloroflexota bacterium]